MRKLKLKTGQKVLLDRDTYKYLAGYFWRLEDGNVVADIYLDDGWKRVTLAQAVLGVIPEQKAEIVFLDGNRLNCQRGNLKLP